jgi:hypothetical protein
MKSYHQIYKELKKLVNKVSGCRFIPDEDKKDIVSAAMEQIYKKYAEGKLVDDFNEIKGYNFIIIRNFCFSYKKRKKKIEFVGIIDNMLEDVIDETYIDEMDYDEMKKQIIHHSRYYKFTELQRNFIYLLLSGITEKDKIKYVMNLSPSDYQSLAIGTYHRLRGRKNKTYRYKIFDVEDPSNYELFDTTQSVMKYLELKNLADLKEIIKNRIIYKNKITIQL